MAKLHVETDCWKVASFDESNTFTAVLVPPWMRRWCCAPPLRAGDVWNLLPDKLRGRCTKASWVFPRYCRLAMGSSHSVHILMAINTHTIGKALVASSQLKPIADDEESSENLSDEEMDLAMPSSIPTKTGEDEHVEREMEDEERMARHANRLSAAQSEPGA